jgi:serine/threonine protein kinase/TolB-like protein/Tfp pilus assembly protein PilF
MVTQNNDNQMNVLEEALTRYVDEYLEGRQPDVDGFAEQYPQCKAQLKERLQDFREITSLFDSLVHAHEIEFASSAAGEDLAGRRIGSFEIVRTIGRGGMGVVYLARDTKLDRAVAVKSIPTELQTDSNARTRFRREARLLASLNHPNIAVIHDIVEQDEGAGYLILEYVPGEALSERLTREPFTLKEALSIGQQIAEAVSAAHEKGVVHRDLKPGNIKITPENRVKVLDFGLAKASGGEDEDGKTTVTQPGRIIGTPAYMSPEQARGRDADHRSDIWSFGCILYEMLTGQVPFKGQTAADTLARIIEREPDWGLLPENTSANIRALIRRCLAKEPGQRLQHIGDVAIEISETLTLPATTPSSASSDAATKAGSHRRTMTIATVVAVIAIACGMALWSLFKGHPESHSGELRVLVLPFENLGSAEDDLFADGITGEMIARLASVDRLKPISRYTAMQYRNREAGVRQIAEDLRVDYVLDCTVQCERPSDPNSPVRMSAHLIRATDDTHVWANAYERDMSGVCRLQSDVAVQVAQALNIALLEPERQALARKPTENAEAYDLYVRANEYVSRGYQLEDCHRIAIRMYEQAVELDDEFALAHAKLSQAYAGMYHFHDHSEEHLAKAKAAVDRAFELDPDLPEANWALGFYYYWGHDDCDQALPYFEKARSSQPKNSRFISAISYAQKWQGKFDQALTNIEEAYELDPLSHTLVTEAGLACLLMRKYTEAEDYFDRAIELAPDYNMAYEWKARLYLRSEGDTKKARAVVEEALQNVDTEDQERILYLLLDIELYDDNYQKALDRLDSILEDANSMGPRHIMLYARIYDYWGKKKPAKLYYDIARSALENRLREKPQSTWRYRSLGIAYAGLDRDDDAIEAGKKLVELIETTKSKSVRQATFPLEDLARINVMIGKHDAAIGQIEYLLSVHGRLSRHLLQLDPAWKPLHDQPQFK